MKIRFKKKKNNNQETIESMEISELLSKGRDLSDLSPNQYKRSWAR